MGRFVLVLFALLRSEEFPAPIDPAVEKYWMGETGVDLYIGGAEHAVLHLLYARFWHKVLFDIGVVSRPEPFRKLVNQGIILGEDSQKMSKSRGNVVNPDAVVAEYGADTMRLFEMFIGPLEQMKPWSTTGIEGVYRFLGRVWRLVMEEDQEGAVAFFSGEGDRCRALDGAVAQFARDDSEGERGYRPVAIQHGDFGADGAGE